MSSHCTNCFIDIFSYNLPPILRGVYVWMSPSSRWKNWTLDKANDSSDATPHIISKLMHLHYSGITFAFCIHSCCYQFCSRGREPPGFILLFYFPSFLPSRTVTSSIVFCTSGFQDVGYVFILACTARALRLARLSTERLAHPMGSINEDCPIWQSDFEKRRLILHLRYP